MALLLHTSRGSGRPPWIDRLEAASLAVAIVAGSVLVWIGVPVGGFWAVAQIAPDGVSAVLAALLAIPLAMAAVGWVLYRASARYEALRGAEGRRGPPAWRVSLSDERASARRRSGRRPLIDIAMTASAAAAVVVITIWFFFFAELRLSPFP
jgi:hypothetical protein